MQDQQETLTFDELATRYPRQWVATRVAERDPGSFQPVRFILITKDADIYRVRMSLKEEDCCIFHTGPAPEIGFVGMF